MKNAIFMAMATALSLQFQPVQAHQNYDELPIPTRSEILKNADVLWAGEGQFTYLFDEHNLEKLNDKKYLADLGINTGRFGLIPLKDLHGREGQYAWDISEMDLIYTLISPKFLAAAQVYADADFKTLLTADQAIKKTSSIDTLMMFNPQTNKEMAQVVVNQLDPNDVKGYTVKQIIYFDQKTNSFNTLVEAFAPLVWKYNNKGEKIAESPLYWIKVNHTNQKQDLNSPDIFWARRTLRAFELNDLKNIKNTKTIEACVEQFLTTIEKNYATEDIRDVIGQMEKMPAAEVKALRTAADTIITYDPETFKEIKQIVPSIVTSKNISKIRFILDWTWDSRKKMMSCQPIFFAPIAKRFDDNGLFLMEGPVFYKPI